MDQQKKDPIGISLLILLFILLGILGVIYYRSIDWDVLKRLEDTPIAMPTPIPPTNTATPSATLPSPSPTTTKQ